MGPPVFITPHAQREWGKVIGVGVYMQGCIQKVCQGGGGGGEFEVWKKGGGRKLTIVLCEAQGGCYTLHLLCWHASITLACKMLILAVNNQKCKGGRMTPPPP